MTTTDAARVTAHENAALDRARAFHSANFNPATGRPFSTDPGWYTDSIPDGVPSETLEVVYANARKTHAEAGGHGLAYRMQRVMDLVKAEMHTRGLRPVASSDDYFAVTWIEVEG